MKIKCEQCGAVYEDSNSCPQCGTEAVRDAKRAPLEQLDRDSFWQAVKYSDAKEQSEK